MNAIVIYQGKYGATKQYANWLGEEFKIIVKPADKIRGEQLKHFDALLIGTSVYVGKLQIEKWMRKNLEYIRGKKIFFFQVAGTPPEQLDKRQAYNRAGIPAELIRKCEFYFLPGRMFIEKLSRWDRFMLKMGARMVKDPNERKKMLTNYDQVKTRNLDGLILGVKKYFLFEEIHLHKMNKREYA